MAQILELHSVDELQRLQQQFPGALVLVYVYKADVDPPVISGRAERSYRSVANSIQPNSFQRQVIFTRQEVDSDRSLRDYGGISSVPMVLYFINGNVVQRLEDITDTRVWKVITKHAGNLLAQ